MKIIKIATLTLSIGLAFPTISVADNWDFGVSLNGLEYTTTYNDDKSKEKNVNEKNINDISNNRNQ